MHIVLFNPEIPQNTGNIGRMCAFANCQLHLIEPLGFQITDRHLKRSGMDYWHALNVRIHPDWESFRASPDSPRNIWLFTTHATRNFWDAGFGADDGLLFGSESKGCPQWLHSAVPPENRLTLPRFHPDPLRSLNLSTAVGIATYEALRQAHR